MDIKLFKSEFKRILDLVPEETGQYGQVTRRGLEIIWPQWEENRNGYLIFIQLFHLAAPELLRTTINEVFETYPFQNVNQVYVVLDVISVFASSRSRKIDSKYDPDVLHFDDSLIDLTKSVIGEKQNKHLTDLLIIGEDRKLHLVHRIMYSTIKSDVWRTFYLQLIKRSKKNCDPKLWEKIHDEFVFSLLNVRERNDHYHMDHNWESSFYGKLFKKHFPQKEIDTIAKQFISVLKSRNDIGYSERSTIIALADFHPSIREFLLNHIYTQMDAMSVGAEKFKGIFYGAKVLSNHEKRDIIVRLYKKCRENNASPTRVNDNFNDLAKKLGDQLGKKNFQRFQVMEA